MPDRPGQLDQISQAIGQLEGRFDGVERYMHDREHGLNDLRTMLNGLSAQMTRDVATAKAEIAATVNTAVERMEARIATIDERVSLLEQIKDQERGARGLAVWFLQSPLVAWLTAAILVFAAWWKDHPR